MTQTQAKQDEVPSSATRQTSSKCFVCGDSVSSSGQKRQLCWVCNRLHLTVQTVDVPELAKYCREEV